MKSKERGGLWLGLLVFVLGAFAFIRGFMVQAINAPSQNAGVGAGAISIDAQKNIAIGTTTVLSNTRLNIRPSIGSLETINPLSTWTSTTPMPAPLENGVAFTDSGYMFYMGGAQDNDVTNPATSSVFSAPISSITGDLGSWTRIGQTPFFGWIEGAKGNNGYMYLVGGYVFGIDQGTTSVFYAPINGNGTLGTWQNTSPLPSGEDRMDAGIAVGNNCIYLTAGTTGGGNERTNVYYAPINGDGTLGTWAETVPVPYGVHNHYATTYNGYLYVMGGWDETGNARREVIYAPINANCTIGSWQYTTQLPYENVQGLGGASLGDLIFVGGGTIDNTDNGATTTVAYTQPDSDGSISAWVEITPLLDPRQAYAMTSNGAYLYGVGGEGLLGLSDGIVQRSQISLTSVWNYALQVVSPTSTRLFGVRGDGKVAMKGSMIGGFLDLLSVLGNMTVSGTLSGTNIIGLSGGGATSTRTSDTVVPGVFSTSSGNFGFRSSLGVTTSSVVGIPAEISVYGSGYLSTQLAVGGIAAGNSSLNIGETNILGNDDSGNADLLIAQPATLSQTATIQSLSFYVATANGKLRLGIYDATGPSGGPGQKKAETNEFTPTNGWNTASVIAPVQLTAGTYWLAYLPESNNLHFRNAAGASSGKYYSYAYGVMPTTYSVSPNTTASNWSFYATFTTGSDPHVYVKSGAGASSSVFIDTTDMDTSNGVSSIMLSEAGTSKWNFGDNGVTNAFFINNSGGSTLFSVTPNGYVGINTASPQSGLDLANGMYAQFQNQRAGAPTSTDCDAAAERGRWTMDITNNRLYVCLGSSTIRWSYTNLN